jgi:hypothetical protein
MYNFWDITTVEHLRNISKEFPDIQLSKCEKAILIVLQKIGYEIWSFKGLELYAQFLISASFFNACMNTNIEKLFEEEWLAYQYQNSGDFLLIEELKEESYNMLSTRHPDLNISFESFESLITQLSQREYIDSLEIFLKNCDELLGLSKEASDEMHRKTMEKDLLTYNSIRSAAASSRYHKLGFDTKKHKLIFDRYVSHDFRVISKEDKKIAMRMKETNDKNVLENVEDIEDINDNIEAWHTDQFDHICGVLNKYKQPSIFGNIYNNYEDTALGLLEILDKRNEISHEIVHYLKCCYSKSYARVWEFP